MTGGWTVAVVSAVCDFLRALTIIIYLLYKIVPLPFTMGPGGWVEELGSGMRRLPSPGSPPGRSTRKTFRQLLVLLEGGDSYGSLLRLVGLRGVLGSGRSCPRAGLRSPLVRGVVRSWFVEGPWFLEVLGG